MRDTEESLPSTWLPLSREAGQALEYELHREMPEGHPIHGVQVQAIARRAGRDDVLFRALTAPNRIYWVHLTWHVETDPTWPWTSSYESLHDFALQWRNEFEEQSDAGDDG